MNSIGFGVMPPSQIVTHTGKSWRCDTERERESIQLWVSIS